MSLRVWLPLTGTLENKGISNITPTNVNATVNSSGKIGSCYNFAGSGLRIKMTNPITNGINSFSICTWFYMTVASEALFGARTSGSGAGLLCFLYADRILFDDGARFTCNYNVNNLLNSWHHIACVKTPTQKIIYIDGVSIGSLNTTATTATIKNEITIGNDSYEKYTGNDLIGKLNDFRIYDHCLSAAEVKEISLGLVLHYKLDDNVLTITNAFNMGSWDTNTASGGFSVWGPSGHSGSRGTNTDRQYIYSPSRSYSYWIAHGANTDTSKYYIFYLSPAFDGGYRSLSCIVKEENSLPIDDAWFMPRWNANVVGEGHAPVSTWTHKYPLGNGFYLCLVDGFYLDGSNDLVCLTVNNGHKVYISEIWLENNRLIASNPLALSTTTQVLDSSGYGHNGTIVGDLILNAETKRYSTSTKWNSSSPTDNSETGICYIQTPITLTTPLQMSITWWAKPENGYGSNTTHAAICTSNNASRPTDYNTTAFHHRDGGFDIYPSDGSGVKRLSFTYTKNEWHHYAITYDGTTARSYLDGVEKTSVTVGTNKTLATFSLLYIGYSQAGGARRKTLGTYSDFRIYATALSTDDIKQLYNTAAKIDNLSNVHSFELNENGSNKLTKTGIFKDYMVEPFITLTDGSKWQLILYHYVDGGNNLFTSSNATFCNDFGLYSRLAYIDNFTYDSKYEFYVLQDDIEYRWTLTSKPTATSISGLTTVSGYTNPVNGLAKPTSLTQTYIGYNSWWGACGCWTSYSTGGKTGIPGFGAHSAAGMCTKYLALYARISEPKLKIANLSVYANNLIER